MGDYTYQVLTQDEQDDILTEFLHVQEQDLFCHNLNRERYENILADKDLEAGAFKNRITDLYNTTLDRINEVTTIINSSLKQLPPADRLAASISRLQTKKLTMTQ